MSQVKTIHLPIVAINTNNKVAKQAVLPPSVKHPVKTKRINPPSTASQKSNHAKMTSTVSNAVVQVNDFLQSQNRGLEFSVDKSTGKTLIKVVDRTNGKILRQIPPEYVVRLAQTLHYPDQMSSTGIKTKA